MSLQYLSLFECTSSVMFIFTDQVIYFIDKGAGYRPKLFNLSSSSIEPLGQHQRVQAFSMVIDSSYVYISNYLLRSVLSIHGVRRNYRTTLDFTAHQHTLQLAVQSAVLAMIDSVSPYVRLTVWPSVTVWYCVKTRFLLCIVFEQIDKNWPPLQLWSHYHGRTYNNASARHILDDLGRRISLNSGEARETSFLY